MNSRIKPIAVLRYPLAMPARTTQTARALLDAMDALCAALAPLRFSGPVTHVYNPLLYARGNAEAMVKRFATGPRRVVMMGMNPGPWGMAQTGVPFGEVEHVRDWMNLANPIDRHAIHGGGAEPGEHPKRPIQGLECPRSEVSGRRLWGLFSQRFGSPKAFFAEHFIVNYCPLCFMAETGRNITPDKLPAAEREPVEAACDAHLAAVLNALKPELVVGVGKFAERRAQRVIDAHQDALPRLPAVCSLLHPSPASPAANRGWAEQASKQLVEQGVWDSTA